MGSDPFFQSDEASRFDLIVIGGGINGAAIAREAALRGISVLLLEKDDLCAGTSAASTRLIHGGLRYLEHAELGLVYESLGERERLLETAPHLVTPLEIYLPLTRSARRGRLTIAIGLTLYDLLSWRKTLPRHRMLSRDAMLEALPGLDAATLVGGAAYFDAQVRYPERLVVENALDAEAAGAVIATQTKAEELIVEEGTIAGVAWSSDGRSGRSRASVVVNAAGPWVDAVLGGHGGRRLIGGTRGCHLVAEPFAGAPGQAVYAEAASDGRPFFVIPWNGLYLIGTTDERDDGDPGDAAITPAEYDYLVTETQRLFPAARDLPGRVRYTFAGVRPLPVASGVRTGAITRRHQVVAHPDIAGLFSIVGGKLTTHRALAVDCLQKLRKCLAVRGPSPTEARPLPGALETEARDALLEALGGAVGEEAAARWWRVYGARSRELLALIGKSNELNARLGPDSTLLVGELVFALEREYAHSLVDCLQRRTMVGLDADFGRADAPLAADWLVRLGIWDKTRAAAEVTAYRAYARRFGVPGTRPGTPS